MKLPLVQQHDVCLTSISRPVSGVGLVERVISFNLLDTLKDYRGIGLAAPQVGINYQIFVISINGVTLQVFNPKIISKEGSSVGTEGCLSLPNTQVLVSRAEKIEVEFLDETGTAQRQVLSRLWARCFQHEFDHLNGILITDHLGDTNEKPPD